MDRRAEADIAFKRGNLDRALELSEEFARLGEPKAVFTCGLLYEKGTETKAPNMQKAWHYFYQLAFEHRMSEGYIGCARVLLAKDDTALLTRAEVMCQTALEIDGSRFAHLVLGDVYSRLGVPSRHRALRHYLMAFVKGAPWGMRKYARLCWRSGFYMRGFIGHIIATMVFPFFVLFQGWGATRSG